MTERTNEQPDETQVRLLRLEVALEKNLTGDQAKRLTGTTREQLLVEAGKIRGGEAGHAEAVRRFGEAAGAHSTTTRQG